MRTCKDCERTLPDQVFAQNRNTPWRHTRCNRCRGARERAARWARLPLAERQRREARAQERRSLSGTKVCLDCNQTKALGEYTPIKIRPGAYYSRCRTCLNEAARARYHSTPEMRAAEIERTRRNQRRRSARSVELADAEPRPTFDQLVSTVSTATGIDPSIILEPDRVYEA